MLLATFPGPPHVAFNDGDTFSGASASQGWLVLDTGSFTQNGGAIVRHAILGENSRVCKNAVVGGAYAPGEEMLISVTSKGAVVEENAVLRPGDMM